jgi:hypothetical protein
MLLKRFEDDNGRLWYHNYRASKLEIRAVRKESVFVKKHYYLERIDGVLTAETEHYFGRLEADADRVIQKIIDAARSKHLPRLSLTEKATWDLFLLNQTARTPDYNAAISTEEMLEKSMSEWRARARLLHPDLESEICRLEQDQVHREVRQNAFAMSFRGEMPNSGWLLRNRGIHILRAPIKGYCFLIGSNPVLQVQTGIRRQKRDGGYETWLPVAPDVVVGVGSPAKEEELQDIRSIQYIRNFNALIAKQSSEIAASSRDVVGQALDDRKALHT